MTPTRWNNHDAQRVEYSPSAARCRMHTAQILRRSEDLPVLIEMVDQEEKIAAFLPVLEEMMAGEALMVK